MENKHCSPAGRRINDFTGVFLPAGKTISLDFFSEWPHEQMTTWKISAPPGNRSAPWCLVLGSCCQAVAPWGGAGWMGFAGPVAVGCACTSQLSTTRLRVAQVPAPCISTMAAAETSPLSHRRGRGVWTRPSTGNALCSLPNAPAALKSISHRRFWNSSWKAFQNSSSAIQAWSQNNYKKQRKLGVKLSDTFPP